MNISKKDKAIKYGISDPNIVKRFKSKLRPQDNGCINFAGTKWDSRDCYQGFSIYNLKQEEPFNTMVKAHRFAYALEHGFDALPNSTNFNGKTKVINHICHNMKCVNPDHLNILTALENVSVEHRKPKNENM